MFNFENLKLRKIERKDLSDLLLLKQESWENTHRISLINEEDQIKWFEKLSSDVHQPSSLVMIADARVVTGIEGTRAWCAVGDFKLFGIDWINQTAEVGWDIFEEFRKQGFGKRLVSAGCTFAFNILNLRRLSCEILESNIASQKCAEARGFKLEGIKRQAVFKNGQYQNSLVYGLLR
jgi:RimJ/RimL family protein N-acetyltransferase